MIENAVTNFGQGFNCAQSVCMAYAQQFGVDQETAARMAAGFGGGMGRLAGTCGAVSGAVMILGLKHGAIKADDKQAKETTYAQVREFVQQFTNRAGSTVCKDLLECDISTPDGLAQAQAQKLFSTRCTELVRTAAEVLEGML